MRKGACFSGEFFLGLLPDFQRDGLLWIPLGGVDEIGSGTDGGSSGSGGGGIEIPVRGDRRLVRPTKGFNSSSPSGPGGGKGRGLGMLSDLLGAARIPNVATGGSSEVGSPSASRDVASPSASASSTASPASLAAIAPEPRSGDAGPEKSLPMRGRRRAGLRRGLADLGGDADRLLSRISGLYRAILALVGEAKDGRLRLSREVASVTVSLSLGSGGVVRRRFGADSSIA